MLNRAKKIALLLFVLSVIIFVQPVKPTTAEACAACGPRFVCLGSQGTPCTGGGTNCSCTVNGVKKRCVAMGN